jgi:hypothetical protein
MANTISGALLKQSLQDRQPRATSALELSLDDLAKAIDVLAGTVAALEDRLEPALLPPVPPAPMNGAATAEPVQSQYVMKVHRLQSRVESMREEIERLTQRLQA